MCLYYSFKLVASRKRAQWQGLIQLQSACCHLALFRKGKLRLSAAARCVAHQFGEVYHLSLIAVGPRNGTEQFFAFISVALEKNLGAIFQSEAIFLNVFISQNCYLILSLTHFQGLRQRGSLHSSVLSTRNKRGVGGRARCSGRGIGREAV